MNTPATLNYSCNHWPKFPASLILKRASQTLIKQDFWVKLGYKVDFAFITLMKQQSWLSCHRTQNPEDHRSNQAGTWRGSGDVADPEQRRSLFLLENTCCAHVPCVKVTGRQNNGLCIFMRASSSQKNLFADDEPGSLMMLSAASRGKELWGTMFPLSRV